MYGIIALVAVALGFVLMKLADHHPAPADENAGRGDDGPQPSPLELYETELLAVLMASATAGEGETSARTFARCALMAPSLRAALSQRPAEHAELRAQLAAADDGDKKASGETAESAESAVQAALALALAQAPGQKLTVTMVLAALRQGGGPIGALLPPWLHNRHRPISGGSAIFVVNDAVTTFEQASEIIARTFELDDAEALTCATCIHHLGWYRFGPFSAEEASRLREQLETVQQQLGTVLKVADSPPDTRDWQARPHGLLAPVAPDPEDDPFSWVAPTRDDPDSKR